MWKPIGSVLLVLVPALYFGYVGKPTEMLLAIVAGGLAAAFLNIERIRWIKAGPSGFETELKQAIEEAYATTKSLKALARPLLLATFHILTVGGHYGWGRLATPEKHSLISELEAITEALSLDDQKIKEARDRFYRNATWEHYRRFMSKVIEDKHPDTEIQGGLRALLRTDSSDFPSEKEIRGQLGDLSEALEPDHIELLQDYLYYKENRSLRPRETANRE
ncbi:MAG: hypothetical protein H8D43_01045 [Chloroflexi bacterium]|nr:hypothetical protein [Chloroflexota bacterium]